MSRISFVFFILLSGFSFTQQLTITTIDDKTAYLNDICLKEGNVLEYTTTDAKKREITLADVVQISFGNSSPFNASRDEDIVAILTNGDKIYGQILNKIEDGFKLKNNILGEVDILFENARAIKFLLRQDLLKTEKYEKPSSDIILYTNFSEDKGSIHHILPAQISYYSTILEGDRIANIKDLIAIYFAHIKQPPKITDQTTVEIALSDGSHITGQLVSLSSTYCAFKTAYGHSFQILSSELSNIYIKAGNVVYLSDLTPSIVEENPNFIRLERPLESDLEFPYQNDMCVFKKSISINGKVYRKGLGVHAYSSLTFKLDEKFEKFKSTIGIDDCAQKRGSVQFIIYVDGNKVFESKIIRGGDDPQHIEIPLKSAREIRLVVDFAKDDGICDLANWADARLIKSK